MSNLPGKIKDCVKVMVQRPENALMILAGVAMSLAILAPLGIVFWKSFQVERGLSPSVYSLANYARLLSPRTVRAIMNSFIVAGGSALLAGILGGVLAWIIARTDIPFKTTLQSLNIIPFFVSPLVGAIAWSMLASPHMGLLNHAVMALFHLKEAPFNIYSLGGIILVSGLFHTPFVYLFCLGPFQQMDPALEQAARVSGATRFATTLRITLPLVAPAIFSALLLAFVLGIEDLGSPLVLGFPYGIHTISTLMFEGIDRFPPDYNFGAALGVLLVSITGLAIWLQRRIMASRSFTTVTGRGYRPQQLQLGWGRYLAFAVNILYLIGAVGLPIGILLIVSFSRAWLGVIDPEQFTLQYYQYLVTTNPLAVRGLVNSLILATSGATLAIVLAFVVAYAIHRTGSRARGWLDFITTIPIAVSGLVLAIGLLVALIRTPLYGTLWILLVAYIIRFFTYGQRSVSAVMVSVSADVEESARVSGAGWFTTMRRIVLPLIWPGLVGGWLLLFITFMREVSMSMLLARSGTETLSVALYEFMLFAPVGALAAFTMVQVLVLLGAALVFLRFTGSQGIRVQG